VPGERFGAVWGNPEYPANLKDYLRRAVLYPVIYLDTMSLSISSVAAFAREWRHARPTLLFGHAHSLYLLACLVRQHSIDGITPRSILSTSMMLLANERATIESVFGVNVFDRYGCEEVGLIGCECERHSGLHMNIDHLIVEFLDEENQPAAHDVVAHVVITDLLNHDMPLLRYRVEDLAASMSERCACGRGLPLMHRVAGRVADFLIRRDGVRVAGISLIENSLTRIPGFAQMQIIQHAVDRIELRVVPGPDCTSSARRELIAYFRNTFPGIAIELCDVQTIPREASGKYRFAICNVNG